MYPKHKIIVINSRICSNSFSGLGRYFKNIMKYMPKNQSVNFIKKKPLFKLFKSGLLGHLWDNLGFFSGNNRVWLPTHTGKLFLKDYFITIHDLQPIFFPQYFNFFFVIWYKFTIPIHIYKAKKIFVLSNYVKKMLEKKYIYSHGKIILHSNGYEHLRSINLKKVDIKKKYAVILGTVIKHKLTVRNIKIWLELEDKNFYLYIIGQLHKDEEVEFKELLRVNKQLIYLDCLDDKETFFILKKAQYLYFISPYEGFGIPALEAIFFHIPIIYPKESAIEEIADGYGLGVNAFDSNDIAKAIRNIKLINTKSRKYINLRKKILKNYSWKRSAQILYNNLIND